MLKLLCTSVAYSPKLIPFFSAITSEQKSRHFAYCLVSLAFRGTAAFAGFCFIIPIDSQFSVTSTAPLLPRIGGAFTSGNVRVGLQKISDSRESADHFQHAEQTKSFNYFACWRYATQKRRKKDDRYLLQLVTFPVPSFSTSAKFQPGYKLHLTVFLSFCFVRRHPCTLKNYLIINLLGVVFTF